MDTLSYPLTLFVRWRLKHYASTGRIHMTIHSTEGLVVDTSDVYSNGNYQYLGGRLGELDLVWFEFCVIRM